MGASATILVADDEPNLRRVLSAILLREGYDVRQAENGEEAIEQIDSVVDVVITDLKMPRADGMAVLKHVATTRPSVPVIMITAFGSVDNAVAAVKAGAFDYIEKPFEQEQIRQIVAKAVSQASANLAEITTGNDVKQGRFGLVGASEKMDEVFEIIERVANTPSTVLITGESGTGKELAAKALHEQSSRADQPFIKINCAAIPKNLMESELFGYEKGAFTGATASKPGRFELADGGTLFLDEIGETPIEMQVKLLRAIQESEFERVGGLKTLKVNVRLITATNRDLEHAVTAGNFRDDLYYRLNVVPLRIPALRERSSDIPLLVDHIIDKFNTRLDKHVEGIASDALEILCNHQWPGNIRELENVLERTMLFCKSNQIECTDLPSEISQTAANSTRGHGKHGRDDTPTGTFVTESGDLKVLENTSLKDVVRAETSRLERELIAKALDETGGNVTQAAKQLKISRKSLQMKMKEFGLRHRDG